MAAPRNYLNNKDLLKEIHKSKMSYSSFIDEDSAYYDIIISKLSDITPEIIQEAKVLRANRLTKQAWENAGKSKLEEHRIDVSTISDEDIVFRVMTFDHIPLDSTRKKNPKTVADSHCKVNFPPFMHYKLRSDGSVQCVGKSHWINGVHNGHFSTNHGQISNTLGSMCIKLVERFSSRSNWRGYSYRDEMIGSSLVQLTNVILQFNEHKSQNVFSYASSCVNNVFIRVLNLEKRHQSIRDDLLEQNGLTPSNTRLNEAINIPTIDDH